MSSVVSTGVPRKFTITVCLYAVVPCLLPIYVPKNFPFVVSRSYQLVCQGRFLYCWHYCCQLVCQRRVPPRCHLYHQLWCIKDASNIYTPSMHAAFGRGLRCCVLRFGTISKTKSVHSSKTCRKYAIRPFLRLVSG